jgi:hypothetical protein
MSNGKASGDAGFGGCLVDAQAGEYAGLPVVVA